MKVYTCEYLDYGGEWRVRKIVDSEDKAEEWARGENTSSGDIRTYQEYEVE